MSLQEKVDAILKTEVNRRLDAEFIKRVEEESTRKALPQFLRLKSEEWPKWLKENVEPRVEELAGKIKADALILLRERTWLITCDKCATKQSLKMTPEMMAGLLAQGWLRIGCGNPNCKDWISHHVITIQLKDLIGSYLTSEV